MRFLENLSAKAPDEAGWPGILVGDMSQPRGGPMITGHASHQIGLDADIWLTPMPDRNLSTRREREEMSGHQRGSCRWSRRRSLCLDRRPPGHDQGGGARLRPWNGFSSTPRSRRPLPRGDWRPHMAEQGPSLLRAQLPFSRSHRLPGWQRTLQRAGTRAARGGLRRPVARLLVQAGPFAPQTEPQRQTGSGNDDVDFAP